MTATRSAEIGFPAAIRGRAIPGSSWAIKGRSSRELAVVGFGTAANGWAIVDVRSHPLRLLHEIVSVPRDAAFAIAWRADGPATLRAAVLRQDVAGRWTTMVGVTVAGGPGQLSLPAGRPAGRLALALEPPPGSRVTLAPMEVRVVTSLPGSAARASAAPAALRLTATNDAFPALAAAAPASALRAQFDLCRRLGLFDHAAALHDAIVAGTPDIAWTEAEVRALCQVWITLGNRDALRALLARRPDLVATDDEVAALAGWQAVTDGAAVERFARLPSGLPNYALAAQMPRLAEQLVPDLLALEAPPAGIDAAHAVLAANYWCAREPGRWLAWLAAYTAAHDLGAPTLQPGTEPPALRLRFSTAGAASLGERATVSVIMAAFDAAATVARAIESLLDQSLLPHEILVCDDCSADGTLDRLRRYVGHPRVRVFRSLANQGPYNIRNALLPRTSGYYATFQDSDDYSHPRRLEWQVAQLRAGGGTGLVAAVAGHIRMAPSGQVAVFANQRAERVAPVTCMAERAAYLACGPFRSVIAGADSEGLERLRETFGIAAVAAMERPLLFALASDTALTRQPALQQTAAGYVAPARRAYRDVGRLRGLLGAAVIDDAAIDHTVRLAGLFRAPAAIVELAGI